MPPRLRLLYAALAAAPVFIPVVALFSELRRPDIVQACVTRLPLMLFYAAMIGVGATVVLVIATGRLAYRGEKAGPA